MDDVINWANAQAWFAQYERYLVWAVIVALMLYAYRVGKNHKIAVPKAATRPKDARRNWFTGITQLGVAKKLRGFTMGKKAAKMRKEFVREYMSMQWLMAVEKAWSSGLITHEEYREYTDELAFKFRDKTFFVNSREKLVKKRIKNSLKDLKKARPLPFPDLPTPTEKETEGGVKPALTKAA